MIDVNNIDVKNKIDETATIKEKYDNASIDYEIIDYEELASEEDLVLMLIKAGLHITTAESCTGGMISSTLVNVSGASSIFDEAYVTYANESKTKLLGVPASVIEEYGAVSKQTAYYMAVGAAKGANADVAIAVTGIAGPDGGSDEKPVGTVYAGVYFNGNVNVFRYNFTGDRFTVRSKTTKNVISDLYNLVFSSKSSQ